MRSKAGVAWVENVGIRIYSKQRWKRLRLQQLSTEPLCRVCRRPASQVDHIKPVADGGEPWSLENLQSLCATHHSQKTARDKMTLVGADGLPVTRHWWGDKKAECLNNDDEPGHWF